MLFRKIKKLDIDLYCILSCTLQLIFYNNYNNNHINHKTNNTIYFFISYFKVIMIMTILSSTII